MTELSPVLTSPPRQAEYYLQQIILHGALYDAPFFAEPSVPLAAAHLLTSGEIWLCQLYPENEFHQHWRAFSRLEWNAELQDVRETATGEEIRHVMLGGAAITLSDASGHKVGTVRTMTLSEREKHQWARWTSPRPDEATRTAQAFVRALEVGVLNHIVA